MDKKARKESPEQPVRPILIGLLDAFEMLDVSRSFGWKLVKEDPDFPETLTIGNKRLVRLDGLERYAEIKAKKSAALQSARMKRVRAHRVAHDGEFDVGAAEKKMPA
jgi:hypothetical protein